jgi:hypothetical protein
VFPYGNWVGRPWGLEISFEMPWLRVGTGQGISNEIRAVLRVDLDKRGGKVQKW